MKYECLNVILKKGTAHLFRYQKEVQYVYAFLYLDLFLLITELGLETTKQLRLRFRQLLTWNNGCKIQIIVPQKKEGTGPHLHT